MSCHERELQIRSCDLKISFHNTSLKFREQIVCKTSKNPLILSAGVKSVLI